MSVNISRTVIFDGIEMDSTIGLDMYNSSASLSSVCLFRDYPESLLHFASFCCILFMIVGIPGNLITVCALVRCKKFRNAAAIFIINLSISDLAICCTVLPITVSVFVNKSWVLGKTLCRLYPLLKFSLSGVTLFSIVAITINRYILIIHPHIYHRCYNKHTIAIMIMVIWTMSFAFMMPTLFEVWGRFSLDPHIGFCALIPDINNQTPKKIFMTTFFFVPCIIMFLCYVHIFWVVRKVTKKSSQKNKNTTVFYNRGQSSSNVSLHLENETAVTEIQHVLSDPEAISEENSNESETNPTRLDSNNMSKRIRKHLQYKLKQINMKQWFPTKKDKKLRRMIIAIMICFCVCHLPVMVIKNLYDEFSSYPTMVFISYLLLYATTCLNPILYVVMSTGYREAYKSLFKSIFIKQ